MKLAIITDTHFGARNDNLNFNEYFYKFYDNIFFPTLKERGITTINGKIKKKKIKNS